MNTAEVFVVAVDGIVRALQKAIDLAKATAVGLTLAHVIG